MGRNVRNAVWQALKYCKGMLRPMGDSSLGSPEGLRQGSPDGLRLRTTGDPASIPPRWAGLEGHAHSLERVEM